MAFITVTELGVHHHTQFENTLITPKKEIPKPLSHLTLTPLSLPAPGNH